MTNGTSQGLFIVVAIVIFGIFVGLSYSLFGDNMGPALKDMFETSFGDENNGGDTETVIREGLDLGDYTEEEVTLGFIYIAADNTKAEQDALNAPESPISFEKYMELFPFMSTQVHNQSKITGMTDEEFNTIRYYVKEAYYTNALEFFTLMNELGLALSEDMSDEVWVNIMGSMGRELISRGVTAEDYKDVKFIYVVPQVFDLFNDNIMNYFNDLDTVIYSFETYRDTMASILKIKGDTDIIVKGYAELIYAPSAMDYVIEFHKSNPNSVIYHELDNLYEQFLDKIDFLKKENMEYKIELEYDEEWSMEYIGECLVFLDGMSESAKSLLSQEDLDYLEELREKFNMYIAVYLSEEEIDAYLETAEYEDERIDIIAYYIDRYDSLPDKSVISKKDVDYLEELREKLERYNT